jgi:MFS family permease
MDPLKNSAGEPNGGKSSEVTVQPDASVPKRATAARRFTLGFRTVQALPRLVWLLGTASLFNDVSSEAIFPLLPQYLTQLGAPILFIGLIEGSADALASVIKLLSGRLADRGPRRLLVTGGYTLPALARAGIAAALAPWQVLAARLVDRAGKGIRSGPRDAMLADAVDAGERGSAFGLNRSMDHLGAALGPLVAWVLGQFFGLGLRTIFIVAAVLGLCAPSALFLRLRDTAHAARAEATTAPPGTRLLREGFFSYLGVCVLFALGNSSDAFLLVRAHEAGWSTQSLPLLWFFHHLVKSAAALPGGALSDRRSRAVVVASGWAAYAVTYVGFGFASSPVQIVLLFLAYALYHGLAEGAERAIIADLAERGGRGRAFGLYHGFVGVAALPAGLVTGLVWQRWGARWAFGLNAACAALASAVLFWLASTGRLRRGLVADASVNPPRVYPRPES